MAKLLILEEAGGAINHMWNSLKGYHQLYCANSNEESMQVLHKLGLDIDMIIASVHNGKIGVDVFRFVRTIKADPLLRCIPLICFSAERSQTATYLDSCLEGATRICGADNYLSMDSFCSARESACKGCQFLGNGCDYDGLRNVIENSLRQGIEQKPIDVHEGHQPETNGQ